MKIMVIFGTRPELIKLAPVILEAQSRISECEVLSCSTGQHREMLDQAMRVFNITPDIDLNIMRQKQTLASMTATLMDSITDVLEKYQPDIVIVQGDTTTAFVSALAAFYQKISVAHVEAGLRTGDMQSPFPEELNRSLIGKIANWHFSPTQRATENLLYEHVDQKHIFQTGNTVVDSIKLIEQRWDESKRRQYFEYPISGMVLLTTHRRENQGSVLKGICEAINILCKQHPDLGFLFPVHLNPNVRKVVFEALANIHNLRMIEPLDFEENLMVQSQCCLIITDSGGIQEEAPSFGVPVVVMREHTERLEGIDEGFSTIAGVETQSIVDNANHYLLNPDLKEHLLIHNNPYGDGRASKRILDVLLDKKTEFFGVK